MPGGGIDESNAALIVSVTRAKEIHLTGRKTINSEMIFKRPGILMGGVAGIQEFSRKVADIEKIREIINILKQK